LDRNSLREYPIGDMMPRQRVEAHEVRPKPVKSGRVIATDEKEQIANVGSAEDLRRIVAKSLQKLAVPLS